LALMLAAGPLEVDSEKDGEAAAAAIARFICRAILLRCWVTRMRFRTLA